MADFSINPPMRSDASNPRGVGYVQVARACKIGSRWCVPGDVIKVEKVDAAIMPIDNRLDVWHAERLIKSGHAKLHSLVAGDRVISVAGENPKPFPTPNELRELAELEAATDPGPRAAERGTTPRQKSGAL